MEWQAARTWPVQNPPNTKSALAYSLVRFLTPPLVEASPDPMAMIELNIPPHAQEEIAYHVQIMNEAGFIEALDLTNVMDGYDWRPRRLIYDGREFIDTIRDAEAWRLTKETAKNAGVASIKALFEIGKSYARQKLIEHGVHLS